jgi:hypothetical protein
MDTTPGHSLHHELFDLLAGFTIYRLPREYIAASRRIPSLLAASPLVSAALSAKTTAEFDKAMAIAARALADARAHGESALVAHLENIIQEQFHLWQYWSPPKPPSPKPNAKRGRRRESYDISNEELCSQMENARKKWFTTHPHCLEMTQRELLEAMGFHPTTETRRVREWCQRLKISWDVFRRR